MLNLMKVIVMDVCSALSILQKANGDKDTAFKMLREDTAIVEAYYGQKMDAELLRFKALSEIEGQLKC